MGNLIVGTILADTYEIIEEIGSGGGGIVYRARHLRLQTDVVVKKIKDEVRNKVNLRQEADILKKLKHPYLPRVYDFIETEDGVYTVMDFIKGENLNEAVKRHGKYSQKQVLKWAEQLGEALGYLHSQKPPIIHSDIKPANIMLTEDGNICLIDFNISLAIGGTMESAVGISAGYSPPEQYRDPALYARITHNYTLQKIVSESSKTDNDRRNSYEKTETIQQDTYEKTEVIQTDTYEKTEIISQEHHSIGENTKTSNILPKYTKYFGKGIDARSDIYSLGSTLYFLLMGKEPPIEFDRRIPINQTNIYVSEGFAIILEKMMDISPEKRYQNGGEFLKAVRNCHKLDRRYIVMHRKQTAIQLSAIICMAIGVLTVIGGTYKIRVEKNSRYYSLVSQALEVMEQYDFDEAQDLLDDAKGIYEARVDAYEEEVYLLYLSEDYDECIKQGENYINTVPFILESDEDEKLFGNIYYLVGNSYYETDDYSNARLLFENALEYNSENGLYYRDYAVVLAKLGQTDKAQKQLDIAIELGISQDSIYMAQGEIAHMKGQYDEAVQYLNQAIMTTEEMQMKKRAIMLCVDVYKAIGDEAVDNEIELLEKYVNQFSGNGNIVMSEYLADAYVRKAKTDETISDAYYQKALERFNKVYESGYVTYQLQENIAILYESLGDFENAENMLLQMISDYPERYEPYKRLAFLEADKQQIKENSDRDYRKMQEYYTTAKEKYSEKEQDMEMDMLDNMMQELRDGGWL